MSDPTLVPAGMYLMYTIYIEAYSTLKPYLSACFPKKTYMYLFQFKKDMAAKGEGKGSAS